MNRKPQIFKLYLFIKINKLMNIIEEFLHIFKAIFKRYLSLIL